MKSISPRPTGKPRKVGDTEDSKAPRLGELAQRWRSATPFIIVGGVGLVVAGMTAAATAFTPSYLASWAVAYLVLVVGVAQIALGLGQAWLAREPLAARTVTWEVVGFNLGHVGVLAGQLLGVLLFTVLGSVLLVAFLAVMIGAVRGSARSGWRYAYWLVAAILLVSIPTGVLIAALEPA